MVQYTLPDGAHEADLVIDGFRLRLVEAGSGFPVVLLHGLGDWANTWNNVMARLNRGYRLIAPDLPGHGLSDKSVPDYSAHWYLHVALRLVDALHLELFAVVGESAGGLLASMLALFNPQRVVALGLVGSAGLGKEVSLSLRLASVPGVNRLLTFPSRRMVRLFSRSLFYRPDLVTDEWVNLHYNLWFEHGVRKTVLRLAQRNLTLFGQRLVLLDSLKSVTKPVAVFWGRQDRVIPVEHAYRLKAVKHDTEMHIYDNCGHMPQWELPDQFASDLGAFLDSSLRRQ